MADIDDDIDWAEFAATVAANHRPHAGHFSWETNRPVAELGAVCELQASLAMDGIVPFIDPSSRGPGNDPPDCEANSTGGGRVAIEVTELVDGPSIAAAKAGEPYEWKDWSQLLTSELQRILNRKDNPSEVKDPPYEEYLLLIFSDEPGLVYSDVKKMIEGHRFMATKLIDHAYLLLSYDPWQKRYPYIELDVRT